MWNNTSGPSNAVELIPKPKVGAMFNLSKC